LNRQATVERSENEQVGVRFEKPINVNTQLFYNVKSPEVTGGK
jgi:hypothetical protein